jgi:hypothetical protein
MAAAANLGQCIAAARWLGAPARLPAVGWIPDPGSDILEFAVKAKIFQRKQERI